MRQAGTSCARIALVVVALAMTGCGDSDRREVPPTITIHPTDQTVLEGDAATFTVAALGTFPLGYQWQEYDGSTWQDISGETGSSYTVPATALADDGRQFRCEIANAGGSVTSNAAALTVQMLPPTITTHPADQAVWEGETAAFTMSATGSGTLTYQWQRSDDGGSYWTDIAGATGSSYTTPATTFADDGAQFTCVVTNAGGSVESNAATLTINKLAWARRAGGICDDTMDGVAVLSDDSVVVTGSFHLTTTFGSGEPNETAITSTGWGDIFIARYNSDGTLAWAKRAGGVDKDHGSDIAALAGDSVVVTGYFEGTAVFGPGELNETSLTSAGTWDIFIARYNADGSLAWAKCAGGTGLDIGWGVAALSDGSVVVTGRFEGTTIFALGEPNETSLTCAGSWHVFVARYNPDGSLAWAKCAAGTTVSIAYDVAVLSDGSPVVTGYFSGTAIFGPGETNETSLTGNLQAFVARYNPDGSLAWAKRAGGASYDCGRGIAALSDDSIVVTGYVEGPATFGPGEPNETSLTSAGSLDIFIARYGSDGTLAWAKRAGGVGGDRGFGVTALSDNSVAVTGAFEATGTFGPGDANERSLTSAGGEDAFIARYNMDGTLRWVKYAGGPEIDRGYDVAVLSDDSVAVTGYLRGTVLFGLGETSETTVTSVGQCGTFIARYYP